MRNDPAFKKRSSNSEVPETETLVFTSPDDAITRSIDLQCLMPSFDMNEIRIPSALMRERRPTVLFTIVKSTFVAVLLAVISFFLLNALAIAVLAIASAFRNQRLDFSLAYRSFAAPAAIGIFILVWVGALIFFFRERGR